ncbi:substrate-binding domain-containing protein [Thermomicrobium sp. CFH 73360]|nr:substrate-binding domain-containing protein [Thermomicrobium sp. CFH 73360]MCM8746849.1 substrate-binding domain-containing protein [Thermomicrobium sp. CFH 73360]
MVPKLVHPFFEDVRKGGEQKAKELGVDFQWVAPQQADPAQQVSMIEDLIRKKVHAISISPNEPKSVEPVIAEGMKQGILMMTFDADSPNSQRVMYIGTDNKAAGRTMVKLLNGQGKVGIITGGLGALNLNRVLRDSRKGSDRTFRSLTSRLPTMISRRGSRSVRRCCGHIRISMASPA